MSNPANILTKESKKNVEIKINLLERGPTCFRFSFDRAVLQPTLLAQVHLPADHRAAAVVRHVDRCH